MLERKVACDPHPESKLMKTLEDVDVGIVQPEPRAVATDGLQRVHTHQCAAVGGKDDPPLRVWGGRAWQRYMPRKTPQSR